MATQQFDQQHIPELENPNMNMDQQALSDTEEEENDTLSFCDLPVYGDAVHWEDFSRELELELELDHQTSSSSYSSSSESTTDPDQQQYFEFSTSPTTTKSHQFDENIVFCGKLIPYRQPLIHYNHKSSEESITSKSNNSKCRSASLPVHDKYDFPVRRVSMPAKSRWYLFMFGLASFPVEMELRDIRRRQNRKSMRSNGGGREKSDLSKGKGLWGMIKALGCGGHHHANAAVKAAYGCTPQVVR